MSQVLIRSDVKRVQWHQWFTANGLETPAIHGMRFDRSFLAIAMACGGVGVTLESTRLAERKLASRSLVAPLAGRAVDIRYVGHHLVFPRLSSRARPANVALCRHSWIGSHPSSRRQIRRSSWSQNQDFRFWPKADVATLAADVCFRGQSGRHAPKAGMSAFDPKPTLRGRRPCSLWL